MSVYNKINHAITKLQPKSALKVFKLIHVLFEKEFSTEIFDKHFWKLNIQEQYFVCYYLNIYFLSSERYSFFSAWLNEKEQQYINIGEEELFYEFKEHIESKKQVLEDKLISTQKTVQRRYNYLKKHKIPLHHNHNLFETCIPYRIPLPALIGDFKAKFTEVLTKSNVLSQQEIIQFYENTVDYGNDLNMPKLLYLEPTDKSVLKSCMLELFQYYNNKEKMHIYEYNRAVERHNERFKKASEQKRKHFKRDYIRPKKYDFMVAMYNSFPFIRDNYRNQLLNSEEYEEYEKTTDRKQKNKLQKKSTHNFNKDYPFILKLKL